MPRRAAEIEGLLQHKFGFSRAMQHGSDHRWYELRLEGLPRILTMVSHGRGEIGPVVLGRMARQLRVRGPFFDGMMSCTRSREEYYRQLREAPYPPFDVLL